MELHEYGQYDGLGLAELIRRKEVKVSELVELALKAIKEVNSDLNAVIGLIIEQSDEHSAPSVRTLKIFDIAQVTTTKTL